MSAPSNIGALAPPHAARILPEIYIQLIYTLIVAYVIVEPFEK